MPLRGAEAVRRAALLVEEELVFKSTNATDGSGSKFAGSDFTDGEIFLEAEQRTPSDGKPGVVVLSCDGVSPDKNQKVSEKFLRMFPLAVPQRLRWQPRASATIGVIPSFPRSSGANFSEAYYKQAS